MPSEETTATNAAPRALWCRPRNWAFYAVVLSVLAVLLSGYEAHLFQMCLLPKVAPVVAAEGETLALPVRLLIVTGRLFSTWLPLLVPALVFVALWVGLFWRPHSLLGPGILVTVAMLLLLLIQSIFLIALFQAAEYLPRLVPS